MTVCRKQVPDLWVAVLVPRPVGPDSCRRPILLSLLAADVAPAAAVGDAAVGDAAVGDAAELLDVDVDQGAGLLVFVAADRLTGGAVDVGEPVDPTADQHRVHGRGRHVESIGDLDRTEPLFPPQVHDLAHDRGRRPVRLMMRGRGRPASRRDPPRDTGRPTSSLSARTRRSARQHALAATPAQRSDERVVDGQEGSRQRWRG